MVTKISAGKHLKDSGQQSFLELVSQCAEQEWTDDPTGVCPSLKAYARAFNNILLSDDMRTLKLMDCVLRMMGTEGSEADSIRRAYLALDHAVRVIGPYQIKGLQPEAAKDLRMLPEIKDEVSARHATSYLRFPALDAAAVGRIGVHRESIVSACARSVGEAWIASKDELVFDLGVTCLKEMIKAGPNDTIDIEVTRFDNPQVVAARPITKTKRKRKAKRKTKTGR